MPSQEDMSPKVLGSNPRASKGFSRQISVEVNLYVCASSGTCCISCCGISNLNKPVSLLVLTVRRSYF